MYMVKEIFRTLQGEGANVGRVAVFVRFTGCNLWSGREQDRAHGRGSCARWCDTDFVGGERHASAEALATRVRTIWGDSGPHKFVVLTGGEPMLQVDDDLVRALTGKGFEVAIETNGSIRVPGGIEWICVSPKAGVDLVQVSGDELKLVWPQPGIDPRSLEKLAFDRFWLQPMDGPCLKENIATCVAYCLENPRWRLSLQMHKTAGLR